MPSTFTVGDFDPYETPAAPDNLLNLAQAMELDSGRIIGRGGEVAALMNTTAVEFSDLVSDHLKKQGADSIAAAKTAMQGAMWGAGVTEQWAGDAKTYKTTIEQLKERWAAAVASDFGVDPFTVAGITGGMPGDVQSKLLDNTEAEYDGAVSSAGAAELAAVKKLANESYDVYKDAAADAKKMLKEGPTPANLKALAADGATTWALFNLFGAAAGVPPLTGADGKKLAEQLRDLVQSGEELTPELRAMFNAMFGLAEQAERFQESGQKLSAGQLDFLEQFYAGMDLPWSENAPAMDTGVLFSLPEIMEGSDISAADQSTILAAVGGGLLALSNPALGGGTSRMPESMRGLVDHYFGKGGKGNAYPVTNDQIKALGTFFGAADAKGLDTLEGGRDFSAALTLAVADSDSTFRTANEDSLIAILDVSTRNAEANAALLNGDLQHPDYGKETPEFVVRGLFGPQWKDDGKAAAGLIDWIPEASISDDPAERDLATEAAYNLITTMTNEKQSEHWNDSAYQFFTDGYGRIGNFSDAPIGAANPYIAQAMGDTAVAYIDYLDAPDIGRGDELTLSDDPRADDMFLSLGTRTKFVELVMGDQTAGNELGAAAYAKVIAEAGDMRSWGDWQNAREEAMGDGELISLLDKAYARVYEDATGDSATEAEMDKANATWVRSSSTILKEAVLEIPGVKAIKGVGQVLIREMLELGKWGPGHVEGTKMWPFADNSAPTGDGREGDPKYEKFSFEVTHSVISGMIGDPASGVSIEDVRAADSRLVVENPLSGTYTLRPVDDMLDMNDAPSDPDHKGNLNFRTANTALQGLLDPELAKLYETYIGDFVDQRGK